MKLPLHLRTVWALLAFATLVAGCMRAPLSKAPPHASSEGATKSGAGRAPASVEPVGGGIEMADQAKPDAAAEPVERDATRAEERHEPVAVGEGMPEKPRKFVKMASQPHQIDVVEQVPAMSRDESRPRMPTAVRGETATPPAAEPPSVVAPPPAVGAAAPAPPPVATGRVTINFATDREWTQSERQPKWFGDTRADGRLEFHYGVCQVSIPIAEHEVNEVEKPFSIFGISLPENPKKHVIVEKPLLSAKDQFFARLEREVARRPETEREVLVFIHGFNNTFDDAASRIAVLAYDMGFNGVPVLYSWSSKGSWSPIGYKHDEVAVAATSTRFTTFLQDVIDHTRAAGARRINVVAHSMGNRALVDALQTLARISPDKPIIDEVVMAAPDVPAYGFSDTRWASMRGPARHTTLYASSHDRALEASQKFSSFPPLGLAGTALFLADGLDTIDASDVDFDQLGLNHTYFGVKAVIDDLKLVLHEGLLPARRKLSEMKRDPWTFWTFRHALIP